VSAAQAFERPDTRPQAHRHLQAVPGGQQQRRRRRPPAPLLRHLPAAPLVHLVQRAGGLTACGVVEHSDLERAYYRAAENGTLTAQAADQLAIRVLGLHPMLVWGDDWLVD
jgi:hypothetical protein